jgi:hypothetical protein
MDASFVRIPREHQLVSRRHHFNDTGVGLRSRNIEKTDATTCNAAHREHRIEHAGRVIIRCIASATRDFEDAITAGKRLTYVRAVPNMSGCLCECGLRHG